MIVLRATARMFCKTPPVELAERVAALDRMSASARRDKVLNFVPEPVTARIMLTFLPSISNDPLLRRGLTTGTSARRF